ncbi:MAG: ABC transporter permease subunit, partial [Oscillospiraceae bacterium]|nr:ABC transporter permease subunit [Oscillospiraceae bacterium]
MPYFSVGVTSLINLRGYGMQAGNYTFNHYITLFTANPRGVLAIRNSVFLAVTSATIATVLGTAVATAIHYGKSRLLKAVHVIGLMPEMLPNIVFVIGIMIFWNRLFHIIPLYNSIWILVLAYVTLFLPFSIQYVLSAYSQIGDNLTQAGRVFGGTPGYVFRRITLPLLLRGLFAGWVMIFIISLRELVTASII